MASTDARPVPIKNTAYRLYFDVRNADGTLITTWAGQDSEVSKDGGNFADCTNEATEIQTSGAGFIDLTSTEMNADSVVYKLTVTNTDALPTVITLYPQESGDILVQTQSFTADAITAAAIAADAIGSSELAATAVTEIEDAIYTDARSGIIHAGTAAAVGASTITLAANSFGDDAVVGSIVTILTATTGAGQSRFITDFVASTEVATVAPAWSPSLTGTVTYQLIAGPPSTGSASDVNVVSIAADVVTASALAADAVSEIQSGLATAAALDAVDNFLDTEVAAILADTNELQTDWADGGRLDLILDARSSQASVDTVDTIVDSILVDTGTDIPASIASLDTLIDSVLFDLETGGVVLTAAAIDAIHDEAVEGALTQRQLLRLFAAVLLGKVSGGPGSPVFRDANDTKDRVSVTAASTGDRSAVTVDAT